MGRFVHCDECGKSEREGVAKHERGWLPDGWLRFEIHRSNQGRMPWLQLLNGGDLCSLDCALHRVDRMAREAHAALAARGCTCPNRDTIVGNCPVHGDGEKRS